MNEQRRASGPHPDPDGKLGTSEESNFNEGRQVLSEQEEFNKEEKRVLDLLTQGLSREFPNPQRVGCPDSAVLRGIAFRKLRLAEVEPWLEHLGSCSPCFQEFTELRKQATSSTTPHTGVARRGCGSHFRCGGMVVGANSTFRAANRNCCFGPP